MCRLAAEVPTKLAVSARVRQLGGQTERRRGEIDVMYSLIEVELSEFPQQVFILKAGLVG